MHKVFLKRDEWEKLIEDLLKLKEDHLKEIA